MGRDDVIQGKDGYQKEMESRIVGEAQLRQAEREVSSILPTLINWQCLLGAPREHARATNRCQDGFTRSLVGNEVVAPVP